MGIEIKSGASTDLQTVDPTSKAARVTLYDFAGNVIVLGNRAAVAETAGGVLNAGKDYKLSRTLRVGSTGAVQIGGDETDILEDSYEGTTRNLNQWVETATTMTSAQTVAAGLTLNSAAITTINTGILEASHRSFPIFGRGALIFRKRLRDTSVNLQVTEFGASDCSSPTTALVNNGAFFRKDSSGSLQAVLSSNATEVQSSTFTRPPTTDYSTYEIFLEDSRATFQILSSAGVLIASMVMELGATIARAIAATHINAFHRIYNTGSAPASGGQLMVSMDVVSIADAWSQRPHNVSRSGMGYNSLTSPTVFTQLANYANNAAPTSATLSNTAAGYTTLGGQYQFAAQATNETDFALFGWTNPSPYTFYCTGIRIGEMINLVAVVTTTPSVYHWGAAFNSSAVSLVTGAPYTPMRVQLGVQGFPTSAINTTLGAIGAVSPGFSWIPGTPMAVQPGRFLHIILKQMLGSATATEIFRGAVTVDGFFE